MNYNYLENGSQYSLRIFYNDIELKPRGFDLGTLIDKINREKIKWKFQKTNTSPHLKEFGVFDNSWECHDMAEEMIEVITFFLRNETENYISRYNAKNTYDGEPIEVTEEMIDAYILKHCKKYPNFNLYHRDTIKTFIRIEYSQKAVAEVKPNVYRFKLYDNRSPKRDSEGKLLIAQLLYNKKDLIKSLDKAKSNQDLYQEFVGKINSINDEILSKVTFDSRCINSFEICADDYSFYWLSEDDYYEPKLWKIWKNFTLDVYSYKYRAPYSDYHHKADYKLTHQFNDMSNRKVSLLSKIEDANEDKNHILCGKLEKKLAKIDSVQFKGLRTIMKQYLSERTYNNKVLESNTLN